MRPLCSSVFRSRKIFPNKEQLALGLTPAAVAKLLFRNVLAGLVFTGLILHPSNSRAQQQSTAELKGLKEIESLKTSQLEIEKELQEIKKLLLTSLAAIAAEQPREIAVNTARAPFKGAKNTKLTLIEFAYYQCPFCSRYVHETLRQVEKEYRKTGELKYVFRYFPSNPFIKMRCLPRGQPIALAIRKILGNGILKTELFWQRECTELD